MVKIKTKKKMNLAELIQWAFDNPNLVIGKSIFPDDRISGEIYFAANGGVVFHDKFHAQDDTFTVEIEEQITEETTIPLLLEKYKDVHGNVTGTFYNSESIRDVLAHNSLEIYMIDLDKVEITLLWTVEGGMQ